VFALPKSRQKKRNPVIAWQPYGGRRDWDNIGKAVCDAGNGLLWGDDAQVWRGMVTRVYGAQGEAPHVRVRVSSVADQVA
jgi:Holliday junction resolvase RusA-like endonuclease